MICKYLCNERTRVFVAYMHFRSYQLITLYFLILPITLFYHLHWTKKSYIPAVPIFILKNEKGNVTLPVRLKW